MGESKTVSISIPMNLYQLDKETENAIANEASRLLEHNVKYEDLVFDDLRLNLEADVWEVKGLGSK
jgi:hypothetical protein